MAVLSLAVGMGMIQVSKSHDGWVAFGSGPFLPHAPQEMDRMGFAVAIFRTLGWGSSLADQRCCVTLWYSVPRDSPEFSWERTAGPFELTLFSGRSVSMAGWSMSVERPDGTRNMRIALRMPAYLLIPLLAVPPILTMIRGPIRRARRRKRGLCETCGYDLRGNVTGICSECGSTRPAVTEKCSAS